MRGSGLASTPPPPSLPGPGYKWVLVKQGEDSVNGEASGATGRELLWGYSTCCELV